MPRPRHWWTRVVPEPRTSTRMTRDDTPVLPGISPEAPGSMPRAEDDAHTLAHSPEFHDRPGSGRHTADRLNFF